MLGLRGNPGLEAVIRKVMSTVCVMVVTHGVVMEVSKVVMARTDTAVLVLALSKPGKKFSPETGPGSRPESKERGDESGAGAGAGSEAGATTAGGTGFKLP